MAFKPKIQEDPRKPKPVTLNGEEYRKPITEHKRNPTCRSEETVLAVYLHRFISLFLYFFLFILNVKLLCSFIGVKVEVY